jgi:hypothetical protein
MLGNEDLRRGARHDARRVDGHQIAGSWWSGASRNDLLASRPSANRKNLCKNVG